MVYKVLPIKENLIHFNNVKEKGAINQNINHQTPPQMKILVALHRYPILVGLVRFS